MVDVDTLVQCGTCGDVLTDINWPKDWRSIDRKQCSVCRSKYVMQQVTLPVCG